MQEVFIKLLKSDIAFSDREHLKAWLIQVTINKCIDFKRSFWRRKIVHINEQIIVYNPSERSLMEELFKLSADERNIIYLYHYMSYTIAEISEILEKTYKSALDKTTASISAKMKAKDLFDKLSDERKNGDNMISISKQLCRKKDSCSGSGKLDGYFKFRCVFWVFKYAKQVCK